MRTREAGTESERDAVRRLLLDLEPWTPGIPAAADAGKTTPSDGSDASARHFAAFADDGGCIGAIQVNGGADGGFSDEFRSLFGLDSFLSMVPPARIFVLSRIAVLPEYRCSSAPLDLISAAVEFAVQSGFLLCFCPCQPILLDLYLRLGFRTYTTTYNHPQAGLVVPLILIAGEVEHFQTVHSPLLPLLRKTAMEPSLAMRLAPFVPETITVQTVSSDKEATLWTRDFEKAQGGEHRATVFDGFSDADKARLLAGARIISCEKGDLVIRRGGADRSLFIILSGAVEIRLGEHLLDIENEGDVIGEIAFLLERSRTADVFSATYDVKVLCLTEDVLKDLGARDPELTAKLYLNLARILCQKLINLHRRFVV
jgi:hypothetical protein